MKVKLTRANLVTLSLPSFVVEFFRCWWIAQIPYPDATCVSPRGPGPWKLQYVFPYDHGHVFIDAWRVTAFVLSLNARERDHMLILEDAIREVRRQDPCKAVEHHSHTPLCSLRGGMPPKRPRSQPRPVSRDLPSPIPVAALRVPEAKVAASRLPAPVEASRQLPPPTDPPPTPAALELVQDARRRFAESSGLCRFRSARYYSDAEADVILDDLVREIMSEEADEGTISARITDWNKRMSGDLDISFCLCCGVFLIGDEINKIPSLASLAPLLVPEEAKADLKPASTIWAPHSDTVYAMHSPSELMGDDLHACRSCALSLKRSEIPQYSVAAGYDYGVRPDSLEDLSLLELCLISPARVFGQTVKLKAPASDPTCNQLACTGHVIVFPHDAVEAVTTALTLSDPQRIKESFSVKFIGTASQWDITNPRLGSIEFASFFACRPVVLRNWLQFLRLNNDMYKDVVVSDEDVTEERCAEIFRTVMSEVDVVTDSVVIAAEVKSDSSGRQIIQRDEKNPKAHCEGIALFPRYHEHPKDVEVSAIVRGAEQMLPDLTVQEQLDARDEASEADQRGDPDGGTYQDATRKGKHDVIVRKSKVPYNDYIETDVLMRAAFPHLFLLGRGLPKARESGKTTVTDTLAEKYLLQKDNRFARDHPFIFHLFNMKMRHEVSLNVKLRTDQSPDSIQAFEDLMNNEDFQEELRAAARDPKSKKSEEVFEKLLKYIRLAAPKVPFGAASGHRAVSEALALHDFFGLSSVFVTVSPSDIDSPLTVRLAFGGLEAKVELPDVSLSTRAVYENPVSAAKIFERLVTSFLEALVNIGTGHTANRPNGRATGIGLQKGVFGTSCSYFGVIEAQGRGSEHIHMLLWSGLSPHVLECLIENEALMKAAAHCLNSYFCADLPSSAHAQYDQRKREKRKAPRVARRRTCPVPSDDPEGYSQRCHEVADAVQFHEHAPMCHEGANGYMCCRVAMPQASVRETCAVELDLKAFKDRKAMEVLPGISPLDKPILFAASDRRTVVVEIKRPKSEDERITVFNPATSACTGCNTSMQPLGAAEQAIAALFYILPYATKNKLKAVNSLSLAVEAQLKAEACGSKAPDKKTNKHRAAMYKLTRLINNLNGYMEVSAQMCVSYLLRTPDVWTSHDTWLCHAWPAVRQVKDIVERTAQALDPRDDSDEVDANDAADDERGMSDMSEALGLVLENKASCDPAVVHVLGGESDDDDNAVGPREVAKDNEDNVTVISQHTHYMYRGPELAKLTFYEYCGMVNLITKAQADSIKPLDERDPRNGGRIANIFVPFDSRHPQFGQRFQRIRSKFVVPKLAGAPPPRMPALPWKATAASKKKCKDWAAYMATVFIPWTVDAPPHVYDAEGLVKHFTGMKAHSATDQEFVLATWAENVSRGLRQDAVKKTLLSMYRFRNAKRWSKEEREDHELRQRLSKMAPRAVEEAERLIQLVHSLQDAQAGNTADSSRKQLVVDRKLEVFERVFGQSPATSRAHGVTHADTIVPSVQGIDLSKANRAVQSWTRSKDMEDILPRLNIVDLEKNVSMFMKETKLREEQKTYVAHILHDIIHDEGPNYFFHGGPGCGKSFCATELMKGVHKCLRKRSVAMAPTGIAASHIGGYTLHLVLDLPGKHVHSESPLKQFSDTKLKIARKLFADVRLVVIDEVSMLSPAFLAHIDARLRTVANCDRPFGGYKTILMGDFYQLPPVCSSQTLYQAASKDHVEQKRASRRPPAPSRVMKRFMTAHGEKIFAEMVVMPFKTQQRIDASATRQIERILSVRSRNKPYCREFFDGIKTLSAADVDNFRFATIVLPGNMEREALNWKQTLRWGSIHGEVPVRWRRELTGSTMSALGSDHQETLFSRPSAQCLYQYFVRGAPAYLTENVKPDLGLANGTPIKLLDIVDSRYNENPSIVPPSLSPGSQFVEVNFEEGLRLLYEVPHLHRKACPRHRTMVERRQGIAEKEACSECLADIEWERAFGSVSLCPSSMPSSDETSSLPSEKRVIFSQGRGSQNECFRVERVDINTKGIPFDMGFALTLHKVQGQTLDKVILCLDSDTTYPSGINFESVYVGVSRVRCENDLRLWPLRPGETMDHVFALERPAALATWERSTANESSKGLGRVMPTDLTTAPLSLLPKTKVQAHVSTTTRPSAVVSAPKKTKVQAPVSPTTRPSAVAEPQFIPAPHLGSRAPDHPPSLWSQHRVTGLHNLGNTCFANVIVQSLDACAPTRLFFRLMGESFVTKGLPVDDFLSSLACLLWRMEDVPTVRPLQFVRNLPQQFPDRSQQYDAADLLNCLSDVHNLPLGVFLHRTITCCECGSHVLKDPVRYPLLEVPLTQRSTRVTSMEELLLRTQRQSIMMDELWDCPTCKKLAASAGDPNHKKKKSLARMSEIWAASEVVVVRLLLFNMASAERASSRKNLEAVECAPTIILSDRVCDLCCVVFHLNDDQSIHTGHYVSYRKSQLGDWVCADDANVRRCELPKWSAQQTPYLLFYARREGDAPPRVSAPHVSAPPERPPPIVENT